jgi:putative membrane protein
MMDPISGMGWAPGFGGIFMILVWAVIIFGLVALGKWLLYGERDAGTRDTGPFDVLKTRYARGEITREQYEHMRRDLAG